MSDVRTAAQAYRLGDAADAVTEIRTRLVQLSFLDDHVVDPHVFDTGLDRAVRAFQQQRGLSVDGVVGPSTFRAMEEARWRLGDRLLTHVPGSMLSGDDVVVLQQRLLGLGFKVGRADGLFGQKTEQGVRDFQRNIGIPPDGTCGPATLKALARLSPRVRGGQPNALRSEERIRRAGPRLTGKIVVIDPAEVEPAGVDVDPDLVARGNDMVRDLARRVEGRLVATGVQAFLTRETATGSAGGHTPGHGRAHVDVLLDDDRRQAERAEFANRTDAHLCVSLHLDASRNPGASGVASYFYGNDAHGVRSSVGERFAGLVQREIVARTDLVDLRIHPTVRVDVGYVTNPGDAARLADPAFRDVVAEAIVVAVQRVYLTPESDPATGVLRLGELRAAIRDEAP
jgi:N-acetylmuramoyl-L-alanine amidase